MDEISLPSNVFKIVDSVMTLAVLIYVLLKYREDLIQTKKEFEVARSEHIKDLRANAEEYTLLLEKVLTSLDKHSSLLERYTDRIEHEMRDKKNENVR